MYFLNETAYDLHQIKNRIMSADLTPGIEPVKSRIDTILNQFKAHGCTTLSEIRKQIKTKEKAMAAAKLMDIDESLMILFRREIEGWIQKKIKIEEFQCLSGSEISQLQKAGYKTVDLLYEEWTDPARHQEFTDRFENKIEDLAKLQKIIELTRIRWVSPLVAQILVETGYDTIQKIRNAQPQTLCTEFNNHNSQMKYFNTTIGERDISRIIRESEFI